MVAAEWVGGGDTGAIDAAERQREAQRGVWRCHEHGDRLGNAKVQVPGSIPTHMGASAQQQHLKGPRDPTGSPRKEMSTGSSWGMTISRPLLVPLVSAPPTRSILWAPASARSNAQWQIARVAQGLASSRVGGSRWVTRLILMQRSRCDGSDLKPPAVVRSSLTEQRVLPRMEELSRTDFGQILRCLLHLRGSSSRNPKYPS